MNEEEIQYIDELERAYQDEKNRNMYYGNSQSSVFGSVQDTNLIQWQLELDNILERIDHLLRGHELKFDEKGNLTWQDSTDPNAKIFNEAGVQEVLRVLSTYLNRNTILSNYDEETINWKIYDFSIELSDLVFTKYEQMGLDNQDKIKLYPMIIRQLVDIVHSAYLRALNGGERQSLREARHVTQSEPLGMAQRQMLMNGGGNSVGKKFSLFKPTSWFG